MRTVVDDGLNGQMRGQGANGVQSVSRVDRIQRSERRGKGKGREVAPEVIDLTSEKDIVHFEQLAELQTKLKEARKERDAAQEQLHSLQSLRTKFTENLVRPF